MQQTQQQKTQQPHRVIRLLKKGQSGLVYALFSRIWVIALLLLAQLALMYALFKWFEAFLPHMVGGAALFIVVTVCYVLNTDIDPTAKLTWMVVILMLPVFGAALYWYTYSELGHRLVKARWQQLTSQAKGQLPQDAQTWQALAAHPGPASLARYVAGTGSYPVYANTTVTYFASGEEKWAELLRQLEQAEHYIFLEYFIVAEGEMWGSILDVLARKAAAGVEVRLLYDGTCELSTLPPDYPKRLRPLGIKCKMFAPLTPFISTHYNYRDHRKIVVIDGHTAFTGGVNLADEYINRRERFGHWKDTAVMLQGEAAHSFAAMFLQMWAMDEPPEPLQPWLRTPPPQPAARGFVMPYADCPLDKNQVGERVYMDLLYRATRYVHIMSPYLILDGEMETALRYAAERGVEVVLILPGIPDKKAPYALAKAHYRTLLQSGVQIYEYTPGFVHAKVFVCDGREGVVGTINLDYRSLYHHFECAAYMLDTPCLADIEADFEATRAQCRRVTADTIRHEKRTVRAAGFLLKFIAPLM